MDKANIASSLNLANPTLIVHLPSWDLCVRGDRPNVEHRDQSVTRTPRRKGVRDNPQVLQQNFGANLRTARSLVQTRAGVGISQEVLAERAGQDRTHVSRIEAGEVNLTMKTMTELANVVGLTVSDLLLRPSEFEQLVEERGLRKPAT